MPRLDTPEGQAALAPFIARAGLVFLDNRLCLFDPEGEKDATAWQPAQDWLLALRRRGKAVVAEQFTQAVARHQRAGLGAVEALRLASEEDPAAASAYHLSGLEGEVRADAPVDPATPRRDASAFETRVAELMKTGLDARSALVTLSRDDRAAAESYRLSGL